VDTDKQIQFFLKKKKEVMHQLLAPAPEDYKLRDYYKLKMQVINIALKKLGKLKALKAIQD
tara:strand:+ start:212 stop:394 length:183 start_codon:yes stop_codon:yes gene_type:complete